MDISKHKSISHSLIKKAVFLFLFLFSPVLHAADKIVNIDFEGLVGVSETTARKAISSIEGTSYSITQVNNDIRKLYETGLFDDVYAEKEAIGGGVKLIFFVKEKGIVKAISFRGNKKIKSKELSPVVTLRSNSTLDQKRIAESEEAIRNLYFEKGFYVVDVKTKVVPYDTTTGELELVFEIDEGLVSRIKRISFVGNKVFNDKKLAAQMRTKVKDFMSFLNGSGKYQDEKLQADLDLVSSFYLNRGYVKVKVGAPQISVTRNKESVYITIPVYEGPQYKVGQVQVSGDILTTNEELLSKLKLKSGSTYSKEKESADVQTLTEIYGEQAYAFASVYPMISTDDEALTADINYTIQRGRKIYIERIDIVGNTTTLDKVIRREIKLRENAPYKLSALKLSQRRLYQLGYFEEVNFSTPRGSDDNRVVLVVKVKEKQTGSFSVGAGFSSIESFILTASVSKDNILGTGVKADISAQLSKKRQDFSVRYVDRYFLDSKWLVSASAYRFASALNSDFDKRSFGGSLTFGREIFNFFDVNLGYTIEDNEITNFSSIVPQFYRDVSSGLTSSVTASLVYDLRNNRVTTTKGVYNLLSFEYAGSELGGDNNFWKMTAESRLFVTTPLLKSVIKARGVFRYVHSTDDDTVPLFERFFLGGVNSLRGFDFNTIGPSINIPDSETGNVRKFVYGGDRMFLFNVEYELPVYKEGGLSAVAFVDAGQSFGENEEISLADFRANWGVGFRWISPFGPLRFEWGFPFDRKEGESATVFNFMIGQSF